MTRAKLFKRLKNVGKRLKDEIEFYQRVRKHSKTPKLAKALLALAIGYTLLSFDLIPDFIPIIGQLDDVIIVPLLILFALKLIPKKVIEECKSVDKTQISY